jgi:hypothetical protein
MFVASAPPPAPRHLLITPARSLPAGTVASCVHAYGLDPDATAVVTNAALSTDGTLGLGESLLRSCSLILEP